MSDGPKLSRAAVVESFSSVNLGDKRLNNRLVAIVEKLAAEPDKSFPQIFRDSSELEAFYRFVRNPRVTLDELVSGHFAQTQTRVRDAELALAVHDSTTLSFGDARVRRREGLGRINRKDQGMLLHATLAVDAKAGVPLGALDAHVWTRPDETREELIGKLPRKRQRELPSEGDRWLAQAVRTQNANPDVPFVHVMDSEADDYALLAYLAACGLRYCVRLCKNRRLSAADAETNLGDRLAGIEAACTRKVDLSPRAYSPTTAHRTRHLTREGRVASVSIGGIQVHLKRPSSIPLSAKLPAEIAVNIVRVWEADAPEGEVPVEWILATSEPVRDSEQAQIVVDIYRARWLIEEYFKALKTGCSYEARQLDSSRTLEAALGLFVPIASKLLALRTLERTQPTAPATSVLSKAEILVLRTEAPKRFPRNATVADALAAIAYIGGHIKNNGPPGWMVLARGYNDLAKLAAFAERAIEM